MYRWPLELVAACMCVCIFNISLSLPRACMHACMCVLIYSRIGYYLCISRRWAYLRCWSFASMPPGPHAAPRSRALLLFTSQQGSTQQSEEVAPIAACLRPRAGERESERENQRRGQAGSQGREGRECVVEKWSRRRFKSRVFSSRTQDLLCLKTVNLTAVVKLSVGSNR